ncbi:Restriction endonuclease S subunit [Nostoc flagelliforme CCNUN1]|uniref:Restriction endonuclease S subunit n=1 Tax=Nostoc flagelliforme CCNUN1 TaxID=2038116 RepID=A0A2K8SHF8_9NOSO|nr:restriction endonuclease subunit S [Nostoc flagelliforme]AUB34904.1 Restriction endonuclease S subunit [Nostoc flagelliforme CCNUN1]
MRYPLAKIGDFAKVKGGKRLPKGHDFSSQPTLYPYIRARDIKNGSIEIIEPVFLFEETYNILKRYTVDAGDVCITIVGANIGDIGVIPENVDGANLTENAAKGVELKGVYSKFLKYIKNSQKTPRSYIRFLFGKNEII